MKSKRNAGKNNTIEIDLTSMLDVIFIILMVVMSNVSLGKVSAEEIQVKLDQTQSELDAAKADIQTYETLNKAQENVTADVAFVVLYADYDSTDPTTRHVRLLRKSPRTVLTDSKSPGTVLADSDSATDSSDQTAENAASSDALNQTETDSPSSDAPDQSGRDVISAETSDQTMIDTGFTEITLTPGEDGADAFAGIKRELEDYIAANSEIPVLLTVNEEQILYRDWEKLQVVLDELKEAHTNLFITTGPG